MSRASSASEGEVAERQPKANTANRHHEAAINGSNRVFGLDGASDSHGHKYRALSRSPSPYRRERTRSPLPYRQNRAADRSRSPYRPGRASRGHAGNDSRYHHKRKASPRRGDRPDKRHNSEADRSRHSDPRHRSHADSARAGPPHAAFVKERRNGADRPLPKPISYDEIEKPSAVPDFRAALPTDHQQRGRSRQPHSQERQAPIAPIIGSRAQAAQPSVSEHVERKSTEDVPDYTLVSTEEKIPTQESREAKLRRWAAKRAAAEQQKPKESLLQQAVLTNASEANTPNVASPAPYVDSPVSPFVSSHNGDLDSVPASPDVMMVAKQGGVSEGNSPSAASPSAADYDPTQDDRDRAAKKTQNFELPSDAYHETDPRELSILPAEKAAPVRKQKEFDMFADSDDEDEAGGPEAAANVTAKGTVLDEKLLDNWDDPEGYYKLINNELMNDGRYQIIKDLGRGVFANVAQAKDVNANSNDHGHNLVAIKMIRRNEALKKASLKEMEFLRKVNDADPQDKRNIIRLLGSFDHKGHLCIVFEHMSKNLRDLLKQDTSGHGLALAAVRAYARQMFLGLQHLQTCQVIHLDLKPDNVLVSPDKKTIKLADFGTAVDRRDQVERTEYMVSRFYRAPEIILGMDIGYPVDMWAVGCTVYELWTGKILFTGRSNNQMVKAYINCLGWPSEKLLKKCFANNILNHFELGPPLKFISREVDHNNQPSVRKIEQQKKIPRDMKTRVHDAAQGITTGAPTAGELNDMADMLSACLHMNVDKRISPKEALAHKFITNNSIVPKPAISAVVKPSTMKRGTPGIRW